MRLPITLVCICISVLCMAEGTGWALINVPMAPMRSEPRHAAELDTQYLLGTPVRVDSISGDWALSIGPDGYKGYLPVKALWLTDSAGIVSWQQQPRFLIIDPLGDVLRDSVEILVSPLPFGGIVMRDSVSGDFLLPDGRRGTTEGTLIPLNSFKEPGFLTDSLVTSLALAMTGVPYLWGGTTADALDCSGLTSLCYRMAGVILPRNASAQARIGREIPIDCDSLRAGDLIFMGSESSQEKRVTHVGIYLGNNRLIHCSGLVHQNSIDPMAADYLNRPYIVARRYIDDGRGLIPGAGISIANHPWYFPLNSVLTPDIAF